MNRIKQILANVALAVWGVAVGIIITYALFGATIDRLLAR